MPGTDEAGQRRVDAELGDEPIPGLVAHVSGPMPGGWRVIDIWETREQQVEFQNSRLMPAVARAMEGMPPPSRPFETYEVEGVDDLTRGLLLSA
jgi:hypothetical protein